jgi:hypothetical protein
MRRFSPPDFVKQASREDLYGPDVDLPPQAYADPGRKRFPVHSKAATWLSTAFFLKNAEAVDSKLRPWVAGTLDKMAAYYGIKPDVERLKQAWENEYSTNDLSLGDDSFALIISYPDGTDERHYPLRNAKEVKTAAHYLKQYPAVIPFRERMIMARKILEKAAKFGADLRGVDEFLEKQAGYGGCSVDDVVGLLWNRARLLSDNGKPSDIQIELVKMAKLCREHPEQVRGEDSLTKIATIIDDLDRQFKVAHSAVIPRPEDVLFKYTKKQASEFMTSHCKMTTGSVYKVADFQGVKLQDVKDLLGDAFASEVSADGFRVSPAKMAEIASTLPRPDAAMLDRLLEDVGIVPYSKEAAHHTNSGITKESLREVAKLRNTR